MWPATLAVTMAYVDQLTRSKGIQPQRVKAVRAAMERADGTRAGSSNAREASSRYADDRWRRRSRTTPRPHRDAMLFVCARWPIR